MKRIITLRECLNQETQFEAELSRILDEHDGNILSVHFGSLNHGARIVTIILKKAID